jgi:hypothetical protein
MSRTVDAVAAMRERSDSGRPSRPGYAHDMPESRLISARDLAAWTRESLARSAEGDALRLIAEAVSRLRANEAAPPGSIVTAPPSTGDERYDALIALGFAWAMRERGLDTRQWMMAMPLEREWIPGIDDDAVLPEYADRLRREAIPLFRDANILVRERDWATV